VYLEEHFLFTCSDTSRYLAPVHSVTDKWTDRQMDRRIDDIIMPIAIVSQFV